MHTLHHREVFGGGLSVLACPRCLCLTCKQEGQLVRVGQEVQYNNIAIPGNWSHDGWDLLGPKSRL